MYLKGNYYCVVSVAFFFFSVLFLLLGLEMISGGKSLFIEWVFFMQNSVELSLVVVFDSFSCMFMFVVMLISCSVIYYSSSYMGGDKRGFIFVILVSLFVFSMVLLILSPSLISIILGWDGLGLVSYLLVIYYQNVSSYNAGMLTVLSNRVGDVFILISISWMFGYCGFNYYVYLDYLVDSYDMSVLFILIMVAGMTSSAQIPFSSWLPAAMAAPTPVSSLVHSSTLVTAGVYLLMRFFPMFDMWVGVCLLFVSGLTMLMSGVGACYEYDMSKIIALSTLSQLGLMMGTLAVGLYEFCFFHLLSHAMFSALLFMCAGYVIHGLFSVQDVRMMGGLSLRLPFLFICFNVSNLSLCGVPFLSGFYSSDLILEVLLMSSINLVSLVFFFIATGFTVLYSVRLFMMSVGMGYNCMSLYNLSDGDHVMLSSMVLLLVGSIVGGSVISWFMFPYYYLVVLPGVLSVMVLFMVLFGFYLVYELFMLNEWFSELGGGVVSVIGFLGGMWNMPYLSTYVVSYYGLSYGGLYLSIVDMGYVELLGGQGVLGLLGGMFGYLSYYGGLSFSIYLFFFVYLYFFVCLVWWFC